MSQLQAERLKNFLPWLDSARKCDFSAPSIVLRPFNQDLDQSCDYFTYIATTTLRHFLRKAPLEWLVELRQCTIAAQVGYFTFGKEAPFKDVRQRGCVDAPLFYSLLRKLIFFTIESLGGVRPCSAQPAAALHVCVQREQFVRGKNLRVCASRHQRG